MFLRNLNNHFTIFSIFVTFSFFHARSRYISLTSSSRFDIVFPLQRPERSFPLLAAGRIIMHVCKMQNCITSRAIFFPTPPSARANVSRFPVYPTPASLTD
jgi:hypothetical protein